MKPLLDDVKGNAAVGSCRWTTSYCFEKFNFFVDLSCVGTSTPIALSERTAFSPSQKPYQIASLWLTKNIYWRMKKKFTPVSNCVFSFFTQWVFIPAFYHLTLSSRASHSAWPSNISPKFEYVFRSCCIFLRYWRVTKLS